MKSKVKPMHRADIRQGVEKEFKARRQPCGVSRLKANDVFSLSLW